jgi:hypothetical protein
MASDLFQYKKQELQCPADQVKVDENRVRVVAFFVLALSFSYLLTGDLPVILFLFIDFLLRSFNQSPLSPLSLLAGSVVKQLGLKNKPVDRAPKRFAAFVGLIFLTFILVTALLKLVIFPRMIAGILVVFASLESFAGFCAGCYVYTFINRFKFNRKPVK